MDYVRSLNLKAYRYNKSHLAIEKKARLLIILSKKLGDRTVANVA